MLSKYYSYMERNEDILELVTFLKDYNIKTVSHQTIDEIIKTILDSSYPEGAFYIVDLTCVISQYRKWMDLLPNIRPHYAIKCNPNDAIIQLLAKLGTGFDCASKHEIAQVLNFKVPPEDIIFAHPCKAYNQIQYARTVDVDLMTFDDESELWKIKPFHPKANLILRIKIDDSGSTCRFSCKFGASLKKLDKIFNTAKSLELNVMGVSFHVGSNCGDVETYYKAIRDARLTFDKAKEYGFKCTMLDIGGGFPGDDSGTTSSNCSITFENIAKRIRESLEEFFNSEQFPDLNIIAEPGRYFASASHTLVLNIVSKKIDEDPDTGEMILTYYFPDGVYGSFNCINYDHAKPVITPYNERDGKTYKSIVFGPTCDSMDTITTKCQLPDLAIGEWVYVENFGAYTKAAASTFNGFQHVPCHYILRTKPSN